VDQQAYDRRNMRWRHFLRPEDENSRFQESGVPARKRAEIPTQSGLAVALFLRCHLCL
jgi:hypothetical protein